MSTYQKLISQIISQYPSFTVRLYLTIRKFILPVNLIDKYVPKTGNILDVGCGYGLVPFYLSLSSSARQITATDINSRRIFLASQASRGITNLKFIVFNLIPPSTSSDCILATDLFHHLSSEDKHRLVRLCRHSLSKNGLLIIKEIDPDIPFKQLINVLHDKITTGFKSLEYWPANKMINFFRNYGFKLIKTAKLDHPFYSHKIYVFN